MCTPLRGLLLFLPAALAPAPATVAAIDPGEGPLKIPNAALEPAGWDDLDGWAGDDHASAFATFYASCRPIVRSNAFRLEAEHRHSARSRLAHPAPPVAPSTAGDARPVRIALDEVCAR